MNLRAPAIRLLSRSAIVLLLVLITSAICYAQPGAPASDARSIIQSIVGERIGTYEQISNGEKADDKYFHSVTKQVGPNNFETVFDYYRLDPQTGAPVKIGVSTMNTTICADGSVTNTATGSGEVMIDKKTSKPEKHTLSEVLRLTPSGDMQGTGGGRISVSGLPMGAGKNGKVADYQSTWSLRDDTLRISQQLRVKFKVLFFSKSFNITANFTAKRGSDVIALMRSAGGRTSNYPKNPNNN